MLGRTNESALPLKCVVAVVADGAVLLYHLLHSLSCGRSGHYTKFCPHVADDTCVDVVQAGATETVLAAMTSDKSNKSVKDCGCWALACLTSTGKCCHDIHPSCPQFGFPLLGCPHVLPDDCTSRCGGDRRKKGGRRTRLFG